MKKLIYTLFAIITLASCSPAKKATLPARYQKQYQYFYIQNGDTLYFTHSEKFYPVTNPY